MTGYLREEAIGKTPRFLQGDDTSAAERAKLARDLKEWKVTRAELKNYTKDGHPFYVELQIRPVTDETGWFTHWVSVQRDVTSRRAKEEKRGIRDRNETVRVVAGGIAHDVNNQLGLMAVKLGTLRTKMKRDGNQISPESLDLLTELERRAVEASTVTNRFLELARDGTDGIRTIKDIAAEVRNVAQNVTAGS